VEHGRYREGSNGAEGAGRHEIEVWVQVAGQVDRQVRQRARNDHGAGDSSDGLELGFERGIGRKQGRRFFPPSHSKQRSGSRLNRGPNWSGTANDPGVRAGEVKPGWGK